MTRSRDLANLARTATVTYQKFEYTASGSETSVSGSDDNGNSLSYTAGYIEVYLNGVMLNDGDYTATNGTSITGLAALTNGQKLEIVSHGTTSVLESYTKAASDAKYVVPATGLDVNGAEIILDADADTSITADTDDQIDIKIAGADDFQFAANTFNILSGSTLAVNSGATIANSGTATGFGGDLSFGGDTFGANKVIGSNDTYSLSLETDGNTAMTISTAGEITMPLQPSFMAIPTTNQLNITVDAYTTIVFGTERFDVGSNFASNTFTAPITGKYWLGVDLYLVNIDSAANYYNLFITTSNKEYGFTWSTLALDQDANYWQGAVSTIADMDASDTAYVRMYQSAGTSQTDISSAANSHFGGYLVG